jgi:transposase-like protein/transposase Tn5 family protein
MHAGTLDHREAPALWARHQFQGARLRHSTRRQRVMKIARAMAEQPGRSIPELFTRKYDIDAAYTLFDRPEATPDAIQVGHRALVKAELRTPGRYLLIEDTTYMSFTHRAQPVPDLGPIGVSDEGQGFLLHSVLAVRAAPSPQPDATGRRAPVEVLGLIDQQYLVRRSRPEGEANDASQRRKLRDRESERWSAATARIGPAPRAEAIRRERVADREADIYEYLISCRKHDHGFVVRLCQDRVILDPADDERLGFVLASTRAAAAAGGMTLELRARPGEAARRAKLLISFGAVRLRSPQRPGQPAGANEPVDCWFVRAWEVEAPAGVEPLEWVLYTDRPINGFEDALGVVMDYGTRYLIEEFHKALKTGLKAEELQLEKGHRLFAAIAVMSIVALRLLDIRELGRRTPEAPAACVGLSGEELEILSLEVGRVLTTVAEVVLAIGRLGGHMNRRSDGMPGWITLWRGMHKLRLLVRGAQLARRLPSKPPHL